MQTRIREKERKKNVRTGERARKRVETERFEAEKILLKIGKNNIHPG